MIRSCLLIGILMLACVGGVFVFGISPALAGASGGLSGLSLVEILDKPIANDPKPVVFTVRSGEDARSVGGRLVQAGLISNEQIFRYVASSSGLGNRISVGEYELRKDMTSKAILEKLARGEVRTRTVTVPEGLRIGQIVGQLIKEELGPEQALLNAIAEAEKQAPQGTLAATRPQNAPLEGYLFPETYRISRDFTAAQMVNAMLQMLDDQFTPELRTAAAARGLTPHQALTLASIIEREAVKPAERPVIAAVYLNRLKLGMPLQADPTVQYALANDPARQAKDGFWKKELTLQDLTFDSPYNTYKVTGLPPGPICSPGINSVRAAAQPATNDFLYFVAQSDGSHIFARTFEEHQANVTRVGR